MHLTLALGSQTRLRLVFNRATSGDHYTVRRISMQVMRADTGASITTTASSQPEQSTHAPAACTCSDQPRVTCRPAATVPQPSAYAKPPCIMNPALLTSASTLQVKVTHCKPHRIQWASALEEADHRQQANMCIAHSRRTPHAYYIGGLGLS